MLINKMHEMYRNDRVSTDILNACEICLEMLRDNSTDIERQRLLNFTTWYLENIENELGITEKYDTLEERYEAVRVKLFTRGNVTLEGIRKICQKYSDFIKVTWIAEEFTVNIIYGNLGQGQLNMLQKELREYVPAHIYIGYNKYIRTHGELEPYTHLQLEDYTHQEIAELDVL